MKRSKIKREYFDIFCNLWKNNFAKEERGLKEKKWASIPLTNNVKSKFQSEYRSNTESKSFLGATVNYNVNGKRSSRKLISPKPEMLILVINI